MKRLLPWVICLSLLPSIAVSETKQGYDALALAQYCPEYLRAPKLPYLSTLMGTFGNPLPCVEKAIKQNGLEGLQVDLIDATCHRNKNCPPGAPKPTDTKLIEARAREVSATVATKHPQVTVWLSPALEHDIKDPKLVRANAEAAQRGCPSCKIINSPFSGAKLEPLELHGTKVSAFAVSGDGSSMFDGDTRDYDCLDPKKQNCKIFNHTRAGSDQTYAWFPELNLRCTGEEKAPPPLKRTERPTRDLFEQAHALFQPEEKPPVKAPKPCKRFRQVSGPEIVKTNAESYCNGQAKDRRGNKPMLIVKKQGKPGQVAPVYSPLGKKVASFKYYGSFTSPGLYRWYMGDSSGHTPVALKRALGSEWGFADLGNGECLMFNAIRRQGSPR